jgi:surfeit locus 1 family protein
MATANKQFPWVFTILWLIILIVMISAGFWQLSRAEEKQQINTRLANNDVNQPQSVNDWQAIKAFDQVAIQGNYLNTHFLLDNQIMDGQLGFFVFTAFKTTDDVLLLINRGWHDDDQSNFDVESDALNITALMADWPRPGIQLGEQTINKLAVQHLTYLEQSPTIDLIQLRHCQQNDAENCIILTRVLKLDSSMDHGFKRHWQLPRMTVEKHRAYAVQWFTMSLVLCFIYIVFIKKSYASKN